MDCCALEKVNKKEEKKTNHREKESMVNQPSWNIDMYETVNNVILRNAAKYAINATI